MASGELRDIHNIKGRDFGEQVPMLAAHSGPWYRQPKGGLTVYVSHPYALKRKWVQDHHSKEGNLK
eukprot:2381378-Amphidinium_carterae.1